MRTARRLTTGLAATVVLALALCGGAPAQVPNDDYGAPLALPDNVLYGADTSSATTQPGEPLTGGATCQGGAVTVANTLWFQFAGTGGPVWVTTEGSAFDTIIGIYPAGGAPTEATLIGCQDDLSSTDQTSGLLVQTHAGTNYLVQVGGCTQNSACGAANGDLQLVALANDPRAYPEDVPVGSSLTRTNVGSGEESGEMLACGGSGYDRTVWFRSHISAPGRASFSASAFTAALAVYRADGGANIGCAVGNPATPTAPVVTVDVVPGDYLVQVGSLSGQGPDVFTLQVGFAESLDVDHDGYQRPPAGPDCNDADPGIHPGAADVPGNGLDEDCSGADALPDGDGDGIPDIADKCPRENAGRRDRDRDGCLDPLTLVANAELTRARPRRGIALLRLAVSGPRGAKVLVKCGRRCHAGPKTIGRSGRVTFRQLHGHVLRNGTRLQVWITMPRNIGRYIEFRIARGTARRNDGCLAPGSRRPGSCS